MKTIIISLLSLITFSTFGQTSDILYVPNQNSVVLTYNNNHNPIGFYLGGYVRTSFPQPYIYTTPISFINRLGINVNVYNNSFTVMGGTYVQTFNDSLSFKPDIWIKVNPLRLLLKTEKGLDFSLGLNYMEEFRIGIGLSIPFGGIY
jgi:hypothetical protein